MAIVLRCRGCCRPRVSVDVSTWAICPHVSSSSLTFVTVWWLPIPSPLAICLSDTSGVSFSRLSPVIFCCYQNLVSCLLLASFHPCLFLYRHPSLFLHQSDRLASWLPLGECLFGLAR